MLSLLGMGALKIVALIVTGMCLAVGFNIGHKITHHVEVQVAQRREMKKAQDYRKNWGHEEGQKEYAQPDASFFQKLTENGKTIPQGT